MGWRDGEKRHTTRITIKILKKENIIYNIKIKRGAKITDSDIIFKRYIGILDSDLC